ncbi:plasmid pRiA4b ORF-3 family protein [Spongiactinospora rosea]|uniref:Plasmid pRiA4b ORF-3 family protein n=2 Tax=Spongiactinospora rosea TaxID=2248750 RepID=A0A366LPA8_9ACTN|nr:plasmid pRiA4b ORF-3 family protein [Spongiactinospora rosea]
MIHRIKVTLDGIRPPIWRRLEVPSAITLRDLHEVVQAAFGWEDYHMWVFDSPLGRHGITDPELKIADASAVLLHEAIPAVGDRLQYTYDFGDNWKHTIQVQAVAPAASDIAYPRCLAGRRACPPEDCGGAWGYGYLLEILADPDHDEHRERLRWLGIASDGDFDSEAFDLAATNDALSVWRPSSMTSQEGA